MHSTSSRWKNITLIIVFLIGLIYALPNIYGEDPSVQVTAIGAAVVDDVLLDVVKTELDSNKIKYKKVAIEGNSILIRFLTTQTQLDTKDRIKILVGDNYSVALNLAPVTPRWLNSLGAMPMKLGLDLRGGVRFLMEVDVESNVKRNLEGFYSDIRKGLREQKIHYAKLKHRDGNIIVEFTVKDNLSKAISYLRREFSDLEFKVDENNPLVLSGSLSKLKVGDVRNYTMEQTITTLRNRVNELGVAEAIVQRQGLDRVVVEMPGIQDTARAKDILGKTATLDFVMVDHDGDVNKALNGKIPPGSRMLRERHGRAVLLKKKVILTGDSITGASSSFDNRDGNPAVSIRLGGSGLGLFKKTTMKNIGKSMAVIYREVKTKDKLINGELVREPHTEEKVISVATIMSALGSNFQITGLSLEESRDLALLLRAGALPATIAVVEERIIGPSMGQENVEMGMLSVAVGLGLVLIFMAVYYSVFGLIANIALVFNLVLLVAIMSALGTTLTLPGIAGIVLTLGMAVDANVLIFERIREELRLGMTPKASIQHGFQHAFSTIVDANLTTLIVGIILFAVGTGPVKGFAVTLSIGILTSMYTAITGTRALVDFAFTRKKIKKLLIGI